MSVSEDFLRKLSHLRDNYPSDFKIVRSDNELDYIDLENSEKHGPFENGDFRALQVIESALRSGKQAALQAFGTHNILIHTSPSGRRILNVRKSPEELRISKIMRELEEISKSYSDMNGNPLLWGGYNSYIIPEKVEDLARKAGLSKSNSYSMSDDRIIDDVLKIVLSKKYVAVVANEDHGKLDLYTETTANTYSPKSSSDGYSAILSGIVIGGVIGFLLGFIGCFMKNPMVDKINYGQPFEYALGGAIIGALISLLIKGVKSGSSFQYAEKASDFNSNYRSSEGSNSDEIFYCEACGAKVNEIDDNCSNCGAEFE